MTCREAQERMVDLFDTDPPAGLREHVAGCEACGREYAEIERVLAGIEPALRIQASPDFKERVMRRVAETDAPAKRWRIFFPRLAFTGAAVLALVVAAPFLATLGGKRGAQPGTVVSLLAQSVEAMAGLKSVHLTARMRTRPAENFEYINPECDWVPLEIWKQGGEPAMWRVEKPGRVVVMDGKSALLYIRPSNFASRGGPRAGYIEWLRLLLDADQVLEKEMRLAGAHPSAATLTEETQGGSHRLVLRVRREAAGDYTNDWVLNKNVDSSNHTRVYYFDPGTKRLTGMQIVLHAAKGDAAVFEITGIRYNEPLDPALFTLALPADVIWDVPPEKMPLKAGKAAPQTPREAAVMLFDAFSREDWDQALMVYASSSINPLLKRAFAGLEVISIGEPFKSGPGPQQFVPYEVKLKSGQVKKHALAVRNDNPARRWVFDGGL